jgi:ElaB/YqjD/DUF883 family membrane-anchored ribosome-binding protein
LIGLIQRKTGEGREQITKFFEGFAGEGSDMAAQASQAISQAAEVAGRYTQDAQRYMQEGYQQASRQVQQQVHQAEDVVRQRPVESLAVAFGTGVITGLLVALVMRTR